MSTSTPELRRQVTLFVPDPDRAWIETIRRRFNPKQFSLIGAHVTLCRDDELGDWAAVQARAGQLSNVDVTLEFGPLTREGNLVFASVIGPTESFDKLRQIVLDDVHCRKHSPHITLVHPRNGICSEQQFAEICDLWTGFTTTFKRLTFIEQPAGSPWKSLHEFPSRAEPPAVDAK